MGSTEVESLGRRARNARKTERETAGSRPTRRKPRWTAKSQVSFFTGAGRKVSREFLCTTRAFTNRQRPPREPTDAPGTVPAGLQKLTRLLLWHRKGGA
eukprot:5512330-Prymnesium_polylepis.1